MPPTPIDLDRLLETLSHRDLRYVLVGDLAAILRGALLPSAFAVDLAIAGDSENRKLVAKVLGTHNPKPMRLEQDMSTCEWDEKCICDPRASYYTNAGIVNLMIYLPGIDSFDGLYDRSELIDIDGLAARVASLADLIAMKRVSDRPKDRLHLIELEAIQAEG